jgi:hypothetical protein
VFSSFFGARFGKNNTSVLHTAAHTAVLENIHQSAF